MVTKVLLGRSLMSLMLAAMAMACTPDFDAPWEVKDLRVLGMRAEPPELLFSAIPTSFSPIRVGALLADPSNPERAVAWEAWACSAEASYCEEAS
ncbi:MAG: hypothetical protein JRH20_20550, partial [Deltaproteobacteria bacterium]|nr:hypothetical protein [Deltaproteobacteria bacterium]